MMDEYDFYIARGRSLEAIEEVQRLLDESTRRAQALMDRLGASNIYFNDEWVVGFHFPKEVTPPSYFVISPTFERTGMKCWVPKGRSKEVRDLRIEMREARRPDMFKISQLICGSTWAWTGVVDGKQSMCTYGFDRLGDDWVLSIRAGGKVPLDAEPMSRSEYWARHDAKKAERSRKAVAS